MKLSKNSIKSIKSLHQKKKRFQEQKYLVEGIKLIEEYIKSAPSKVDKIVIEEGFNIPQDSVINQFDTIYQTSSQEFKDLSQQTTASGIIAVINMQEKVINKQEMILFLDQINDPGNLGTIIRLADWYGLSQVFVSPNTVDWSNYKCIQSTMGSSSRIAVHTMNLEDLKAHFPEYAVIGASMEGVSIYKNELPKPGILVMGSESHGISEGVRAQLTHLCSIPSFGPTESLNVGVATAILLHEWRRP